MSRQEEQHTLQGKLYITGILRLTTGMHIGAASDFAPIGAVDSPFIRDAVTRQPIIPGSSLKGKIRTLLVKSLADSYVLPKVEEDPEVIQRMFGAAAKNGAARPARLQFFDLFLNTDNANELEMLELDTYMGEIKFENTIDRKTASANPRQIERVPAGAEFDFRLVYNIENVDETEDDMKTLADGLKLLQMDYLGGHGSRGYGRVKLSGLQVALYSLRQDAVNNAQTDHICQVLKERGSL